MRHFRDAFYRADLFDYNSAEQWQIDGSHDAYQRAHAHYKKLLRDYEAPALDPAVAEQLQEFVTRRKLVLRNEGAELT